MGSEQLEILIDRLERIEATLQQIVGQRPAKAWYTTDEIAALLGRAPWTVRQWCRLRRVQARKRVCGRGQASEWIVSHEELTRIQNEGLLPLHEN
jgi:hypothetical protein